MKRLFTILAISVFAVSCMKHGTTEPGDENGNGGGGNKPAAELVSMKFEKSKNPQLSRDIVMELYLTRGVVWGYMPNNAALTALKPTFEVKNGSLKVGTAEQQSGVTAQNFSSPVTYTLAGTDGTNKNYTVSLLPWTGLPVVIFRTSEGKTFKTTVTDKINWREMTIDIDAMGVSGLTNFSATGGLRGRGNSTWERFPKRAFNMKLDVKPADPVLGMPGQKRWCFLANWRDRTLLRNDVTSRIASFCNNIEWSFHGQHAEVVFNGEHLGNFLVAEHVRVDKNRVNIKEMVPEDQTGVALTGGYLLEADYKYDEYPKFRNASTYNLPVMIKSPDPDAEGMYLPGAQQAYIEKYVTAVEKALKAHRWTNLYDSLDRASFVDYWLIQALTGNTEITGPANFNFYKKRDTSADVVGKLYAGSPWDLDYTTFATDKSTFKDSRSTLLSGAWWWTDLMTDATFKQDLKDRFAVLEAQFNTIPAYIDQQAARLATSEGIDRAMWPLNTTTLAGMDATLNGDEKVTDCATYMDAIARMKQMYSARLAKLKTYVNNGCTSW